MKTSVKVRPTKSESQIFKKKIYPRYRPEYRMINTEIFKFQYLIIVMLSLKHPIFIEIIIPKNSD